MVDTIHIQPNTERNCSKGVDDFYLASCNGTITVTGSLTVEEAVELMQKKILLKKAMVKLSWLPLFAPPDVASPLAKVFTHATFLSTWFYLLNNLAEKQKYLHMQEFMLTTTDVYVWTNIISNKKSRNIFICVIFRFLLQCYQTSEMSTYVELLFCKEWLTF